MSRPLPYGDPDQLGPFRLSARLDETSAGIVYLGSDGEGRQVSVAVLTRGAAGDAAARDRFRAAIHAAIPGNGLGGAGGAGGTAGWVPAEAGPGDPAPVVAAQPEGSAPWVATSYEPQRPGAERFLDPVLLRGGFWGRWAGRRRGPHFQPYWQGSADPAVGAPPTAPVIAPPERPERGLVAAIMALAVMLGLLAVLLLVLFACQREVSAPQPPPSDPPSETYQPPQPPPPSLTPTPSPTPTPSGPTPTPGRPGSPSPGEPGDNNGPV